MSQITDTNIVGGTTRPDVFIPPTGCITNDAVVAAAGIVATKLQIQYNKTYFKAGTAASETAPMHEAYAAGTVIAVKAGSVAIAVGAATVVVDIKKNGTTILTGTFQLDNGNTAYVSEAGTISVASYVAGDVFTAVIVATAGGGTIPTGLWITLVLREACGT